MIVTLKSRLFEPRLDQKYALCGLIQWIEIAETAHEVETRMREWIEENRLTLVNVEINDFYGYNFVMPKSSFLAWYHEK